MKSTLQLALLISCTLLFFTTAQAGEEEKKFSIGLGTYGFTLSYDNYFMLDDEFSGLAMHASFAINDNVAVRGAIYSLEHDDFSALESSGYDLTLVAGTGLATEGFKIYGGIGMFSDAWEVSGFEFIDFSGLQLVGGIGYNWEVVSVDLSVGIRDSDEYIEGFQGIGFVSGELTAISSALTVSARF